MKKYISYITMMALMAVVCSTFTACGGGDDDDDVPGDVVKTTAGVHRIEVSFDGSTTGWEGQIMFIATNGKSHSVSLYKDGNLVGTDGGYSTEVLWNITVESEQACDLMQASVTLTNMSHKAVGSVTVTLKGYVNGTQKNMKVVEIPATETYKTIIFNAEDIGADLI